ncbi:hypothetical protein [Silvanigrella aquatica]|uniref:Uncharacterized protein n=1 Tax=Silvanigrella aquatica TaxID=1915309 RepID=A0A1L4CWX6_9BACT|nr:hypothetical protein [Silvanigrella aquatica]APJ02448.1 hypothetical protein AXG55_00260 [Silvanigrella aquatica]
MTSQRPKLISILIKKKLYEEIEQIISIIKQGFDVHVRTEFQEVEKLLIELLEIELSVSGLEYRLISDPQFLEIDFDQLAFSNEYSIQPTVFVNAKSLESGSGFVKFMVRSPDHLLCSTSSAIEKILKHFGILIYLDVFDSNKLSRLRQIAKFMGLRVLVDAVIQTAYLGGFLGDSEKAGYYLENLQTQNDDFHSKNEISIERCAEKFFSYVLIRSEEAHTFLKSSLSYYAVRHQGFTMTRASQVLQISRTTLQEHLKLADQLGVSNFFDGYREKTI